MRWQQLNEIDERIALRPCTHLDHALRPQTTRKTVVLLNHLTTMHTGQPCTLEAVGKVSLFHNEVTMRLYLSR